MHLWSATRLPTAAVAWRAPDGALALTAIGKVTFRLEPGTSRLAPVQEPIVEEELPGPGGALRLPNDLVPVKPRAEVLLVGAASGPRVRLTLGSVDKMFEVAQGRVSGGSGVALPVRIPGPRVARLARSWFDRPLPADLHPGLWNVAPLDQQLDALPDPIAFVIEGVSPQPLATTLEPITFAAWGGGGGLTGNCPLRPDTVWIDLDRGLACVTFRAVIKVESEEELRATILGDLPNSCEPVPIATRGGGGPPPPSPEPEEAGRLPVRTTSFDLSAHVPPSAGPSALPFRALPRPLPPPPPSARGLPVPPPPSSSHHPPPAPTRPVEMPAAIAPAAVPPPPPVASVTASRQPVAAAPPLVEVAPVRPPLVHDSGAAMAGGVAGASDAAARASGARQARARREGSSRERPRPTSSDLCELVWFHPDLPARARALHAWRAAVSDDPRDRSFLTVAESVAEADAARDRRTITRALSRVTPAELSTLPRQLAESIDDDGFVERPLLVVAGDLTVPLDPAEELKATVALVTALAHPDRIADKAVGQRLREALEAGGEAGGGRAAVDAVLHRIRQAFAAANRALPPDYVETTVQQMLRDERKHQPREVFGAPHLMARIQPGSGAATTLYLPEELANRLPLAPRFRARLIVEPHPQQHAADGDGAVLRALALGRVFAQRPRASAG